MLHKLVNLSDITTTNGRKLDRKYLTSKGHIGRRNKYKQKRKNRVTSADYCIWREKIRWIFPTYDYRLDTPLQPWSISVENWIEDQDWFVDKSKEFIYQYVNTGDWNRYLKIQNKHHSYYATYLVIDDVSDDALRANVRKKLYHQNPNLYNIGLIDEISTK